VTPVWFDYDSGVVRVNTAKGRVKAHTLKQGAQVALAILDPDNPYRYVQVRGRVTRVTDQGADRHIDSLAHKYLGKDKYPFAKPGEVRVMCEIEPVSVSGME
jgi:PPOX class probable F420-dependent enzyme